MKFDKYKSAVASKKRESEIGEAEFSAITESEHVRDCIAKYRAGDAKAKRLLPAWTPMAKTRTGQRKLEDMEPTGLVMLDIDHIGEDKLQGAMECFNNINTLASWNILLVHITPSGHGLRIIFSLPDDCNNIVQAQDKMVHELHLDNYGDYDGACKDLTRLSFFPQASDIKYRSEGLFFDYDEQKQRISDCQESPEFYNGTQQLSTSEPSAGSGEGNGDDGENQTASRVDFKYGDHRVADIVRAYVEDKGEPEEGQTHNFYNSLVSDFRHICDNDPNILIDVLPLFGQTRANRLSQCQSICRTNKATKIPKEFYFWLKDNDYYPLTKKEKAAQEAEENYAPYQEEDELLSRMPELPPVFREYVNIAPKEFKIPTVFSLLPIMGTLATYLQAKYMDDEMHTPTFITIISAKASQGKSFINKFLKTSAYQSTPSNLLHDLCLRDELSAARYRLYDNFTRIKSDSEKGLKEPGVSWRIIPPIISQTELMTRLNFNHGRHMFTFAPEMDTLNKGTRTGGIDKNDLYRIAWDNGVYAQMFKSANSFRGEVGLYMNLLVTGTPAQCMKFFKDIENGLITRCSFTDLGNQDFAEFQPWKKLTKKDEEVIQRFKERCDANTYKEPLVFDRSTLEDYITEKDFDENVPWQYQFRDRQTIDLKWMFKPIIKWLEKQRILALKSNDSARDTFRKRIGVKAFRLALLSYALWPKVTKKEKKIIKDFALWFADLDMMKELKTWGEKYNDFDAQNSNYTRTTTKFSSLWDSLGDRFSKEDVVFNAKSQDIKSRPNVIINVWKNSNLIEKQNGIYLKLK